MSPDNQLKEQLELLKNNIVKSFSIKEVRHDEKNNERILDDKSLESLEIFFGTLPPRKQPPTVVSVAPVEVAPVIDEPQVNKRGAELFYIPFVISLFAFLLIPPIRIAPVSNLIENISTWNLQEIVWVNFQDLYSLYIFNNIKNITPDFVLALSLKVHLPLLVTQILLSAFVFCFIYILAKSQKKP
jgi:hypothetical protein